MEIKRIINISPVSTPTWAKICTVTKDPKTGRLAKNEDDWWYVEVVQWANVLWSDDGDEEFPAIFGCYMEHEDDGGGISFVELLDSAHLHYTTKEPAYMDCVDAKDGSDVKKVSRSDKFAPVAKEDLIGALERAKGNKKIAAKLLGVHRGTIFKLIDKYELRDQYVKTYKTRK